MEVRGVRECRSCGTQWSYFETGSTACPECGSMVSVGVGERALHTDRPVELDLSAALDRFADGTVRDAADPAQEAALEYIRSRGFIDAGELQPLDDTYVAAHELRHVASELGRALSVSEAESYYFGQLLKGAADGERPPAEDVPASLHMARGLAAATAVRAYRDDLRTWLDREETVEAAVSQFESLGSHVRRVRALDGAIDPADADRLVTAARRLGEYLRDGDEADLEASRSALETLA